MNPLQQSLNPGVIHTLIQFDLSTAPDAGATRSYYWTQSATDLVYKGITYYHADFQFSGLTVQAGGSLPTPTLTVLHDLNGNFFPHLVNENLRFATVTRTLVFAQNLDNGSQPGEPFKTTTYFVNGISSRTKGRLTVYNLAVAPGIDDLNASGNRTLSNTSCNLKYRVWNIAKQGFDYTSVADGGCPWAQADQKANFPNCGNNWGTPYFDSNDNQVSDPSQDHCSLTVTGCLKRFPVNINNTTHPDPLPIQINMKASGTTGG